MQVRPSARDPLNPQVRLVPKRKGIEVFKEAEHEALRALRKSTKAGMQPWAIRHCEEILRNAIYHRGQANLKETERARRDFAFNRAVCECIQVVEICKAHARHEPNVLVIRQGGAVNDRK